MAKVKHLHAKGREALKTVFVLRILFLKTEKAHPWTRNVRRRGRGGNVAPAL
jgi:hypothetical protein